MFYCKENFYKKEVEMWEGEEGRAPGHKLNYSDGNSVDNFFGINIISLYDLSF
jgi:hypothetical protein